MESFCSARSCSLLLAWTIVSEGAQECTIIIIIITIARDDHAAISLTNRQCPPTLFMSSNLCFDVCPAYMCELTAGGRPGHFYTANVSAAIFSQILLERCGNIVSECGRNNTCGPIKTAEIREAAFV